MGFNHRRVGKARPSQPELFRNLNYMTRVNISEFESYQPETQDAGESSRKLAAFLGSGSTLMAAELEGRRCFGMDDPGAAGLPVGAVSSRNSG